ncbi:MAG: MATE family efflux transporter [Peptostreptococcaceae bacterium]|nr:MATE family efflux transporter [Peptostreptococcaceae bacterium]
MNSIQKNFVKYVSLNTLSMLGLSFYILIDTFFIVQGTGSNGMAALNIALPIYGFMSGLASMIGIGFGTNFKIQYDNDNAKNEIFSKGVGFVLSISLMFTIIGIFFSKNIMYFMGARDIVLNLADDYIKIIFIFAPAFMMNNLMQSFIRNDHNPSICTKAVISSCIFNCIFDYIFIFSMNMGIFGAALATVLSPLVSLSILSSHFISKKNSFRFVKAKLVVKEFFRYSSLGISSLINELSSSVVIIVFNFIMLKYASDLGVAAYGVIANMALVVISMFNGVGNGIQPLISEYYSKGSIKNMVYVLKMAILFAMIISATIYLSLFFNAGFFTNIFNPEHNETLLSMSVLGIKIYFLSIPFTAINIITATYMQAMAKPRISFIISILRGVIIIVPMALILSNMYQITGMWMSYVVTEIIVAIISITFIIKYSKIK